MLHTVLNKSLKQYPTKQHLHGYLYKPSQKEENDDLLGSAREVIRNLIRDVLLLWTPTHGADIGCDFKDLPRTMAIRNG